MSHAHYFYTKIDLAELEILIQAHRDNFNIYLEDLYSEEELAVFESKLESLAALYAQPLLSELTFDDFYPHPELETQQREFFSQVRSTILLEHLPDLETNAFQVTYLKMLMAPLRDVLVDRGGVEELLFKMDYLNWLEQFRSVEDLISSPKEVREAPRSISLPVAPIDFLIRDIYKELDRLQDRNSLPSHFENEKVDKLFRVMKKELLSGDDIFKRSGLGAKDFDDHLEKLKFILKKTL
jgi:hypothetical protein